MHFLLLQQLVQKISSFARSFGRLNIQRFHLHANLSLQILTIVQSCVLLSACADGLGKSIELVPVGLQFRIQKVCRCSSSGLAFPCIDHVS